MEVGGGSGTGGGADVTARGWTGDAELLGPVGRALRTSWPAAVAVATPGRVLVATTHAAPERAYEIGSVGKALTGMLFADAQERGLVTPTTALGDLLPLADHGPVAGVTLASLAVHRSGLPRLAPGMHVLRRSVALSLRGANPYGETLDELLEQTRGVRLDPARPRYSNLGFELLGHALGRADGRGYGGLLRGVLGDDWSTPARPEDLRDVDLLGSSRTGRPVEPWTGEGVAPAGGIRAGVGTVGALLRAILDGSAPGIAALDPVADLSSRVRIGAGWITLAHRGRPVTWHNGMTGGFASWVGVDRAAGVGVAVLSARCQAVDRAGLRLLEGLAADGAAALD
jgi:CubicO group peptidase (beta-lactamase class C family)